MDERRNYDENDESNSKRTIGSSDYPSKQSLLRRGFLKATAGAAGAAVITGSAMAQDDSEDEEESGEEHHLEASPENIDWGYFDPDRDPVLKIKSGDTVTMECVLTSPEENGHAEFLAENGIDESDMMEEEITVGNEVEPGPGHVVTGPVYIEDAEPGDILEVHVQDIEIAAPYGTSFGGPGGALPDTDFPEGETHVIPFDEERETALFTESEGMSLDQDIEIPLDPFMGVMAVSPRPSEGRIDTIAPSYFGGNMDNRQLGVGSTVYLPVSAEGALFWTGDGHSVQGDGEVSLTAIETSLTPTFEFTLHKDIPLDWPVAETEEHYIPMGFNEDLDFAMEHSVREAISLLVHQEGLEPLDAYRLCSVAVDFNIAEVVDDVEIIHATIPKSLFSDGGELVPEQLSTYEYSD